MYFGFRNGLISMLRWFMNQFLGIVSMRKWESGTSKAGYCLLKQIIITSIILFMSDHL